MRQELQPHLSSVSQPQAMELGGAHDCRRMPPRLQPHNLRTTGFVSTSMTASRRWAGDSHAAATYGVTHACLCSSKRQAWLGPCLAGCAKRVHAEAGWVARPGRGCRRGSLPIYWWFDPCCCWQTRLQGAGCISGCGWSYVKQQSRQQALPIAQKLPGAGRSQHLGIPNQRAA